MSRAQANKELAQYTLEALKAKLAESKREIENLRLKKSKKQEEGKTYLATEKLASTKKINSNERSSQSGSQTPNRARKNA